MRKILKSVLVISALFLLAGCSKKEVKQSAADLKSSATNIAVFIPGIMEGSPIYAKLAQGVKAAVNEYNQSKTEEEKIEVTVFEAGNNQSEWGAKIVQLAVTEKYDVIISSNPSLPEICSFVTESFPNQKFILLDAECNGNDHIAALSYNQKEEAYLSGYISGLMSKSHKLGLIAAQKYPIMNMILLPYYEKGAKDADKNSTVDFRIVGNWYDATKGAELANAMADSGVDVILPICGGASQGVISAAKEKNIYLSWFDENGFSKAPGNIISSCFAKQDEVAKEITIEFLKGQTSWGTTKTVTFADGCFEFVQDDPAYIETVPSNVRNKMNKLVKGFSSGKKQLD